MKVDEETLKRNQRFALLLGSISGAILIAVVYIFVNWYPDYLYWVVGVTMPFLFLGIFVIARIRKSRN